MSKFVRLALAAVAAMAGSISFGLGEAPAQSWRGAGALSDVETTGAVEKVWHRRWHRHRHYDRSWGPALGGFAAGALIGGAIAQQRAHQDWIAYCSAKYRSFDPDSGTYLGYDGRRHDCR